MPISITATAAQNQTPTSPFVGPVNHAASIAITVTALTTAEIDAYGYLKPGVPFSAAGVLVGVSTPVFGVSIEPIKVAASNSTADIAAAGTKDVALGTVGQVNRKIMEDNLGRVLTANEIAGFALAPCTIKLLA